MFTTSPAHSQAAGSPSGAPSTTPATAPSTPGKIPLEAQVLGVEVKDPKDTKHKTEVALGNYIITTLDTELTTLRQQQTPTNKLGLFINDLFIKGLEPLAVPGQPKSVMFQLKRSDDNRDAWSVLFGHKHFALGSSKTGGCGGNDLIELTVGLQDGSWAAKNAKTLCLEYLPDTASKFLILPISFVVAVGTIILIYKEMTALLYILATLGVTALLVVVAMSDLAHAESLTNDTRGSGDSAAIGSGITSTMGKKPSRSD